MRAGLWRSTWRGRAVSKALWVGLEEKKEKKEWDYRRRKKKRRIGGGGMRDVEDRPTYWVGWTRLSPRDNIDVQGPSLAWLYLRVSNSGLSSIHTMLRTFRSDRALHLFFSFNHCCLLIEMARRSGAGR